MGASNLQDQNPNGPQMWLTSLLEDETINSMDYEFNFQMEIRAPYLLAGLEFNFLFRRWWFTFIN